MESEFWGSVLTLLGRQKNRNALEEAMVLLLTPEERDAIGTRLAIIKALVAKQESQRDIAARVGVSIAKVTRCSNYLKMLSDADKQRVEGMCARSN